MKAFLRKLPGGILRPDDEESADAIKKLPNGEGIEVIWKCPRNYKFHRKYFAMLKVGFDAWEPPEQEFRGLPVQKNFDRFREDVAIAAGFYEAVVNLRGVIRAKAKSIAFGAMTEEEFAKLYNATADVLLQRVLKNYTKDDLEAVVNEIVRFVSTA